MKNSKSAAMPIVVLILGIMLGIGGYASLTHTDSPAPPDPADLPRATDVDAFGIGSEINLMDAPQAKINRRKKFPPTEAMVLDALRFEFPSLSFEEIQAMSREEVAEHDMWTIGFLADHLTVLICENYINYIQENYSIDSYLENSIHAWIELDAQRFDGVAHERLFALNDDEAWETFKAWFKEPGSRDIGEERAIERFRSLAEPDREMLSMFRDHIEARILFADDLSRD